MYCHFQKHPKFTTIIVLLGQIGGTKGRTDSKPIMLVLVNTFTPSIETAVCPKSLGHYYIMNIYMKIAQDFLDMRYKRKVFSAATSYCVDGTLCPRSLV